MQGAMGRVKGPFTPSQWMELEHQALVYKYLSANVAIPPSLPLPLRRSLASPGFTPSYSSAFFGSPGPTSGWGGHPYTMGYALTMTGGAGDPEPGRCRRTDGKKYCDQKNRWQEDEAEPLDVKEKSISYATMMMVIYNMLKLDYTMQEDLVIMISIWCLFNMVFLLKVVLQLL